MAAQITPQEIETIREMFDQGHTRAAIAEAMCRDYSTVKRLVARITYNRTDTRRYKPRTPGLTVRVREGVAAGLSYSEIARRTGYAKTTVIRHATTDAQTRARLRNPDPPPEVIETIRQRLVAGDTITAISRVIGISRSTVAKLINEHGLYTGSTQERLEAMFAAGGKSRDIAQRVGLTPEEVAERRKEWTRKRHSENNQKRRAAAKAVATEPVAEEDGCKLITALRAHLPPLTSLSDRVAALGVPVLVRRAA